MIQTIYYNESNGLPTRQPDIVRTLGWHRDKVRKIGKELKSEDKIFKIGKRGQYHLTKRAYGDPRLAAAIFWGESIRRIVNDSFNFTVRDREMQDEVSEYIKKEKEFWDKYTSFGNTPEKKSLLEFAMDIGILITYIMMEAVQPRPNKKYVIDGKDEDNNKKIEMDILPGDKKQQAELWVKNAIRPFDIFQEFLKLPVVKKGLALHTEEYVMRNLNPGLPEKIKKELLAEQRFAVPSDPTWSPHEIDKANFEKLISIFYDIWPWTYTRLEDIKNKLPKMVDASYDTLDEARMLDEKYRKDGTYDHLKQRLLDKHAGKREEKKSTSSQV